MSRLFSYVDVFGVLCVSIGLSFLSYLTCSESSWWLVEVPNLDVWFREEPLLWPYIGDVYILCWIMLMCLVQKGTIRCGLVLVMYGLLYSDKLLVHRGDQWRVWDFGQMTSLRFRRNLKRVLELEVETIIVFVFVCCIHVSCISEIGVRTSVQWQVYDSEMGTSDEYGTSVQWRVSGSKEGACDEFWFWEELGSERNHRWVDKSVT